MQRTMVKTAPDAGPELTPDELIDAVPETLCAAFRRTVERCPERPAFRRADGSVVWTWRTYGEWVAALAAGLHGCGLRPGDRLALMLDNGPPFHAVDAAALQLGATPFSIYATSSPEQIAHALEIAGARIAAVAPEHVDAVRRSGVALDELLVVGDDPADLDELAARAAGGWSLGADGPVVTPDDLATLVFTSGTTGPPKAVQITHANVIAATRAVARGIRFPARTEILSYLPLAHTAERNNSHWFAMCLGFTVTSCPAASRVLELLPRARPTWFFGVPRIFEKLRAALQADPDPQVRADLARALLDVLEDPTAVRSTVAVTG